ncbi:MAG: GNAT family N-acetyltransferase, partial [Candidatus Ornithospirochaeta sp.]
QYEDKDRSRLEDICRATDRSHLEDELLLTLYLRYYITYEKENCFVAADDLDNAVGYIISTSSWERWKDDFPRLMLEGKRKEIVDEGMDGIEGYRPFASEYPAHLHIDILPGYQRMGLGHALMDALTSHYRKEKVGGLMLGVDPENEKGVNFYKKYGFRPLDHSGVWWGLKL